MSQEKELLGNLPDFSLLILCGGKAKRLSRRNKPLLPVRVNGYNKPMIDHIIDACGGALDIIISAIQGPQDFRWAPPVFPTDPRSSLRVLVPSHRGGDSH